MSSKKNTPALKVSFSDFIERFPEVELPVNLNSETIHDFSRINKPLPAIMIERFLSSESQDEFTEYVACFRIPQTHDFHAIVFWKAGLLTYEYILATFDNKGNPIANQVIAGTKGVGEMLVQSVATIEENWIIYCVGGLAAANSGDYDASSSKAVSLELLATGEIITLDQADFNERNLF